MKQAMFWLDTHETKSGSLHKMLIVAHRHLITNLTAMVNGGYISVGIMPAPD